MASEIHISRFNKEMKTIPINQLKWEDCENKIDQVQLIKDETGNLNRIECFSKSINDWIPVFWIDSNGDGFMRRTGFFQFEESYEKAIEIAANLNAIIWGDDGFILYEPNIGVLYDDCEPDEQPMITLDEIAERRIYFQNDIKKAIQEIIKEKEEYLNKKTI